MDRLTFTPPGIDGLCNVAKALGLHNQPVRLANLVAAGVQRADDAGWAPGDVEVGAAGWPYTTTVRVSKAGDVSLAWSDIVVKVRVDPPSCVVSVTIDGRGRVDTFTDGIFGTGLHHRLVVGRKTLRSEWSCRGRPEELVAECELERQADGVAAIEQLRHAPGYGHAVWLFAADVLPMLVGTGIRTVRIPESLDATLENRLDVGAAMSWLRSHAAFSGLRRDREGGFELVPRRPGASEPPLVQAARTRLTEFGEVVNCIMAPPWGGEVVVVVAANVNSAVLTAVRKCLRPLTAIKQIQRLGP